MGPPRAVATTGIPQAMASSTTTLVDAGQKQGGGALQTLGAFRLNKPAEPADPVGYPEAFRLADAQCSPGAAEEAA